MDDASELDYQIFLAEQAYRDAEMERFVNEAILISHGENTIKNINALNEGAADAIKGAITKLAASIAAIWRKFLEAMNTLVRSDKGYLEKYKDVILKQKMPEGTFTMYDYPKALQSILNTAAVPEFNYEGLQKVLVDDQTFVNAEFKNYLIPGSKLNFQDQLKTVFRGSPKPKPFNSSELNMADIYNYCHDYENVKNGINKDIQQIQAAANKGLEAVNQTIRNGGADQQQQPIPQGQQESYIYDGRKSYYSVVYEQYIEERGITPDRINKNYDAMKRGENPVNKNASPDNPYVNGGTGSSNANAGSTKVTFNLAGSNTSNPQNPTVDGTKFSDANKNTKGEAPQDPGATVNSDGKNGSELDTMKKQILMYMKICGQFLAAKQTIFEEIYKNYMTIIKEHVRAIVGSTNQKDLNKQQDNGSEYKGPDNVDQIFNANAPAPDNNQKPPAPQK